MTRVEILEQALAMPKRDEAMVCLLYLSSTLSITQHSSPHQ